MLFMNEIRKENFISSFWCDEPQYIKELYEFAIANNVPIIRNQTKSFLRSIINIKKPIRVLEIGTAIGYSAIIIYDEMKKYSDNPMLWTIENYKKRIEVAKINFKKYKYDNILLYEREASDVLKELVDKSLKFDFIFLDAAKAQYVIWLPNIIELLDSGGILFSDNIFKDGEILESKFLIKKRDRTIHQRMREYLHMIFNNDSLTSYIYDISDGITISIKNE